jgi:hypothetical protein
MRDGQWSGAWKVLAAGCLAAAWATPAASRSVQKCIAADGHVTLTSGACAEGQRLAASYDAVPEASAPGPAAMATPRTSSSRAGVASAGGARGARRVAAASSRGVTADKRCEAAQERRDRTLRRLGLKRTFDDEVWAACRR